VLGLLGMLLIPERTFQAFGIGAITVVFVAVFASVTLLPAIIGILGDRVNNIHVPLLLMLAVFVVGMVIISAIVGLGPIILAFSVGVMRILSLLSLANDFPAASVPSASAIRSLTHTIPERASGTPSQSM
jgi:hypothetical protein